MLEVKPELKTEIGVELYKEGKISLSRAAEIAGTSLEGIKDVLKHRGVKRIVETPSDEEIDRGVDLILE
jgi:predicted HTH domain antitoxin